jgi:hypothetical protein
MTPNARLALGKGADSVGSVVREFVPCRNCALRFVSLLHQDGGHGSNRFGNSFASPMWLSSNQIGEFRSPREWVSAAAFETSASSICSSSLMALDPRVPHPNCKQT